MVRVYSIRLGHRRYRREYALPQRPSGSRPSDRLEYNIMTEMLPGVLNLTILLQKLIFLRRRRHLIVTRNLRTLSRTMNLTTLFVMREMLLFWSPMLQVVQPHNHLVIGWNTFDETFLLDHLKYSRQELIEIHRTIRVPQWFHII